MSKVDNIIKAYTNDSEGLTHRECLAEDFSAKQCDVLEHALGKGIKSIITPEEKIELEQAGFAKDFIQNLAGIDGTKALQSRVKWLGENINPKWYQTHYNIDQQREMLQELQEFGPTSKDAIPALIDILNDQDKDKYVRRYAAVALGNIGPLAKDAIPALITTLKGQDEALAKSAAYALGNIGPDSKEAVPSLINVFKGDDWEGRFIAEEALVNIGKAAIPALINALKSSDPDTRTQVGRILYRIGKDAVPALIDVLKDKDASVRSEAAYALGHIGKQAFFAIPVLEKMALNDPEQGCRFEAQRALDTMMGEIR